MSQFWQGFLSGALASVLAFALAIGWELWRDRRRTYAQAKAQVKMVLLAIAHARGTLERIIEAFEHELDLLADQNELTEAIPPIDRMPFYSYAVSWSLLEDRMSPGAAALRVVEHVDRVNEQISSRELFKVAGAALTGFSGRLSALNRIAIASSQQALRSLEALEQDEALAPFK